MPRRSPFMIRLSEQERAELVARRKEYTSPHRDVVRSEESCSWRARRSRQRPHSGSAPHATPELPRSKWRQRFYAHRLPDLDDRPRGGRPARFSPSVMVAIKALACRLTITS